MQCSHYFSPNPYAEPAPRGTRCPNRAEYYLVSLADPAPDCDAADTLQLNPGGAVCGECAARVVGEYAEKLREHWDIVEIGPESNARKVKEPETTPMPITCDRWPPPYTHRCPNPALYRLTRTHPAEGVQYLGGPVCADCAGVILADEGNENERVSAGGPWDVEEIDPATLADSRLDPLPENVPTPQGAPRFLYTMPPIPEKVERVPKHQRTLIPRQRGTIDVDSLNEGV